MHIIDTDPLYKLFCIAVVCVIPILPAFLLYKIAPQDKFLSSGSFSGFTINATGASAIYIVLFVACYLKVGLITDNIDTVRMLTDRLRRSPWKVECNVKLMLDSTNEVDALSYEKIINQDSIFCFPRSLNCDLQTKQISFYIDNDVVQKSKGKIEGMLVINNGFGSASFETDPKQEDSNKRVITINSVLTKQVRNNYLAAAGIRPQDAILYSHDAPAKAPEPTHRDSL